MKHFILFLRGIVVGIANAIAGVSGGTLAYILGIYEELVSSLANLTKKGYFWKSLLFLVEVMIGVVVGMIGMFFLLGKLFPIALLETITLFAGVIIGGMINDIPNLRLETEEEKKRKPRYIIGFVIAFIVVVVFAILNVIFNRDDHSQIDNRFENVSFLDCLFIFGAIFIGAIAMIFPGISGSLVFMIMGIYYPTQHAILDLLKFNLWSEPGFLWNEFKILISLLSGAIISLLTVSKLMKWLFSKYHKSCLYVIAGFLLGSIFAIYIVNFKDVSNQFEWYHLLIACLVTLPLGIFISVFISRLSHKIEHKREEKIAEYSDSKEEVKI